MVENKISYQQTMKSYQIFSQQMAALVEQNERIAGAKNRGDDYDPILFQKKADLCQEMVEQIEKASTLGENGIAYPDLAAVCKDGNLPVYIQNIFDFRSFVETYSQQWLDADRKFADIVNGGAQNMAEARLIDVATNTLEPHEFSQAIQQNLGPKEMEGKMEASRINKLNQRILIAHQLMRSAYNAEAQIRAQKAHQVEDLEREKAALSVKGQGF